MSVEATTKRAIGEQLVEVLGRLVPTAEAESASRWKQHKRKSPPGLRTRRYLIEWGELRLREDGWIDGFVAQHYATLSLVTDYAMPSDLIDDIAGEDGAQVHQAIYTHLVVNRPIPDPGGDVAPTVQIVGVEYANSTTVASNDTGDNVQIAHDYVIDFMRDRRF